MTVPKAADKGPESPQRRQGTSTGHHTVTISDVAAAAGVSTASVSSVINGKSRVSASTEARILAAIERLGYRINPTARQLRAGRADAIGLVVPELDRPYFGQLGTFLANEVEATGRNLVIQRSGGSPEQELAAAAFARLRMYDGVFFSIVDVEPAQLASLEFSTPVVLLGERSSDRKFDHVAMDNVGGAFAATTHVLQRGARRIAMLGGDPARITKIPSDKKTSAQARTPRGASIEMTKLRTRGYVDAHLHAGVDVPVDLVIPLSGFGLEDGRAAVHELCDQGLEFDAIFAVTDVVAIGALRGLSERGISVPEDVQVIGFDNIAESAYCSPSLTTVDPRKENIARTAMSLLEQRIAGSRNSPQEVIVPVELAVRESTRAL